MTLKDEREPHQRLAEARQAAGFETASEAARAWGWNENTYRSHENGERGLKLKTAQTYAKAFKSSAGYILFGFADDPWEQHVLIAGSIGRNGVIRLAEREIIGGKSVNKGSVARLSIKIENVALAFQVSEDAGLLSFQPNDLIIVWGVTTEFDQIKEGFAIVDFERQLLLRMIRVGDRGGVFHLEHPMLPTITNVVPKSVQQVCAIVPGSQWSETTYATIESWRQKGII